MIDNAMVESEQMGTPDHEQAETPAQEVIELDRDAMLGELLAHCNAFINASAAWRQSSYEDNWLKWQRNAEAVYDPAISAKKEPWQSRAFWPITPAHCENAIAQLIRMEFAPKPALEYKARLGGPPPAMPGMPPPVDQGQMIRDLVLWEREKAGYELERNKMVQEKVVYGSGFMRARFETKTDTRPIQVPIYAPIDPYNQNAVNAAIDGKRPIIGYQKQTQEVITYRGVRCEWVSIWDVFPDPKALSIEGNAVAVRYETTLGEVLKGIEEGYYLPEADKLRNVASEETTPSDKQGTMSDRNISESRMTRTKYGARLICYEKEARLPKKWVLIDGQEIDDPEKLIPAVVRFHKDAIISVAPSESYDGEPMLFKDDYMEVAGSLYGRGVPEMLKDVQLVSSETINQRLDTGSISLDQKFAVNEKAIVDRKDLEENKKWVRMKAPSGISDINHMMMRLDTGTVDRSAFVEPQEWERIGTERTSISKVSLSGSDKDTNGTLGGQQIAQEVTGDKMSYLGSISEFGFQRKFSHAVWALIYQNYNPEDYAMAIGPEKAMQLQVMAPEQVAQNFRLIPKGVHEVENKAKRQAMVGALQAQYGPFPWFNTLGAAKSQIAGLGEDEATFILPEADGLQIMAKAQQLAQGMAQSMVQQHMAQQESGRPEKQGAPE